MPLNADHYTSHRVLSSNVVRVLMLCAAIVVALGQQAPAAAQVPAEFSLVADTSDTLYQGSSLSSSGANSFQSAFVNGANAFFVAYMPDTGQEVWRTDGTQAGTFCSRTSAPHKSERPQRATDYQNRTDKGRRLYGGVGPHLLTQLFPMPSLKLLML